MRHTPSGTAEQPRSRLFKTHARSSSACSSAAGRVSALLSALTGTPWNRAGFSRRRAKGCDLARPTGSTLYCGIGVAEVRAPRRRGRRLIMAKRTRRAPGPFIEQRGRVMPATAPRSVLAFGAALAQSGDAQPCRKSQTASNSASNCRSSGEWRKSGVAFDRASQWRIAPGRSRHAMG